MKNNDHACILKAIDALSMLEKKTLHLMQTHPKHDTRVII